MSKKEPSLIVQIVIFAKTTYTKDYERVSADRTEPVDKGR